MDALHQLHLEAGQPSLRDLQRDLGGRSAPSHAAIHKMFTGSKLPTWGLVEPLVHAMAHRAGRDEEAEVQRFRALWTRAAGSGAAIGEPSAGERPERFSAPISFLLPAALDEIEAVGSNSAVGNFRIPTGFDDLDALLGGWSQGSLIIAGGRPSSGKTTLLLNFCRTASIKYRLPSMLISGEMNSKELEYRLLSAEARVPLHSIRTGQMDEQAWGRLARTMGALADAPIHIATPAEFLIEELSLDATRLSRESELKLLLIDSLQWIADSEVAARMSVEHTLRRLKTLAETLRLPVIITAHAERPNKKLWATNPITQLTHSDTVERVSDVVVILHRPDQDEPESPRAGEADLIVARNRNGPTATVTVAYMYHYCRFLGLLPNGYVKLEPTAHDRELYHQLRGQIPPDGEVIEWLKNNFVLKYFPVRHLDAVSQVAKAMSLEVVGFDDKEANDQYNDLRQAIDNFYDKVLYYTFTDQSGQRLEVPAEWRDREDRTQYDTAMSTIKEVRKAFIEAYDRFLQTCHKKGIDRDASSG